MATMYGMSPFTAARIIMCAAYRTRRISESAAHAVQFLAIAPRWFALANQPLLHCCAALLGELLTELAALVRFVIKRLGYRRRATDFAERSHLYVEVACLCAYVQAIASMNLAGRLCLISIGEDTAEVAGAGGESARLEETRCPEPFVHADAVAYAGHVFIFL